MYDRVLVITINSYYSKVPSTGTAVLFSTVPVPWYNFSKVPSNGAAVLLKSTVPTYDDSCFTSRCIQAIRPCSRN